MAWKKLLWIKQPYPDNYVDATFLSQVKRNSSIRRHEYWQVVSDWSLVVLNLALSVVFCEVFMVLYQERWEPQHASAISSIILLIVGLKWAYEVRDQRSITSGTKATILVTITIRALSPVFLSLTKSTSSDSIWSITAWLCLFNVIFASRPWEPNVQVLVLSTNISLSATIVLASRLPTADAVFHFMIFSVETYVVLPSALRWMQARSPGWYWGVFLGVLLVSDFITLQCFGTFALLLWQVPQAVLIFACPGLFLILQKYKDQIEGPWDPAKPVINT